MDAPKKYIRTFAGDMEMVHKGITPNLAPLKKEPSSPPAEAPKPIPLQTYAGDFSDRMKKMQASTATVLAAEQDAAPFIVEAPPKRLSWGSVFYSAAGVLLLAAAGYGTYVAYTRYLAASVPVVLTPTPFAPVFVDERERVSGAGMTLVEQVEQLTARPLKESTVRLLFFETATSDASVFSALQLPAPNIFLRNLTDAKSMAGVINVNGAQSPFFILSVASYGDTFAGMLAWEPTMPRDFAKLFPPYSAPAASTATTSTAATAPVSSIRVAAPAFLDAAIANHDVRVYRDAQGRSVLLYGYWNQMTLVIARDEVAFTEILRRLATSRTQ